jgi:hypothetical protein
MFGPQRERLNMRLLRQAGFPESFCPPIEVFWTVNRKKLFQMGHAQGGVNMAY